MRSIYIVLVPGRICCISAYSSVTKQKKKLALILRIAKLDIIALSRYD